MCLVCRSETWDFEKNQPDCRHYELDLTLQHMTLVNYYQAGSDDGELVSLVTHLSFSRLARLQKIAEHWSGSEAMVYVYWARMCVGTAVCMTSVDLAGVTLV